MPVNKDFKRVVRARMEKTGESYTAARAHLVKTSPAASPAATAPFTSSAPSARVPTVPPDYASITGIRDAAVKAKTGCDWKAWVGVLDYKKANTWSHREIAEYIHEKYKVPDWWTQMVTVGYERIKGLRVRGQRRDGGYETSKSKVFHLSVARLYRAFNDSRTREKWLPGVKFAVRTKTRDKSMRVNWPDATSVELYFTRKGTAKSQLNIQHNRLPDRAAADKMKAYWTERLAVLAEL